MSRAISNPFLTYDEKVYTPIENNDYDDVNTDTELSIKKAADTPVITKTNFYVNEDICTRAWFVCVLIILIMAVLTMGIINLFQATEIIYGTIGFYAFHIYYIMHVFLFSVFLVIHLFLCATQLFYTMNRMNYINHIVINYSHIWYIYFIKIFFISALVTILVKNSMDNMASDSTSIPLYYNLMLIETLLSSLLITLTNSIVININTIKLMQISMA